MSHYPIHRNFPKSEIEKRAEQANAHLAEAHEQRLANMLATHILLYLPLTEQPQICHVLGSIRGEVLEPPQ